MARLILMIACCLSVALTLPRAQAQNAAAPSQVVLQFAASVAQACVADWGAQGCLSAVSESNIAMLSDYGAALQNAKHDAAAETLKQHCAATTAASQQNVPAYAMLSALTECANTISDIASRTALMPDPSHYQLMIAPLLCLGGNPACAEITAQLTAYTR